MSAPDIYSFSSYIEYLKVAGPGYFTKRNRHVTLDRWAKQLGYRSPRSIAMVLKGQRLPSAEMIGRISRNFRHGDAEHRYFELLVALARAQKRGRDAAPILRELETLNPQGFKQQTIEAEAFSYIADWYHFVIKQLIDAPGFREDTPWISRRLRRKVPAADVAKAIANMLALGILERDDDGRLHVVKKRITTRSDVPDSALRRHHRGMIRRALESLEERDFHNREITSITVRLSPDDIPAAKEMIRRFRNSFHERFEVEASTNVYQLNLQLFEHTTDAL